MGPHEAYQFGLLPLVIEREAGNQVYAAKVAVGWSIRNRIESPSWWGFDYPSVILMHQQYSSFNTNDPNSRRFLTKDHNGKYSASSEESFNAAWEVFNAEPTADVVNGATNYFDRSIDKNPPAWASKMEFVGDVGAFHFYKEKKG